MYGTVTADSAEIQRAVSEARDLAANSGISLECAAWYIAGRHNFSDLSTARLFFSSGVRSALAEPPWGDPD